MLKKLIILLISIVSTMVYADSTPIRIVAAENFYGDIAQQLGEPYVTVHNILSNPQQDPHLFSSSPRTAKAIADAQIIIYNGLGYDAWINPLIDVSLDKEKYILDVSILTNREENLNPHIWYDPRVMLVYATKLDELFIKLDPAHASDYRQNLEHFKTKYQQLIHTITQIHSRYQKTKIIATEPVFNDMAKMLALIVKAHDFQRNIMNDTEPSAKDIRQFENQLHKRSVAVLIYNNQVNSPLTQHMKLLALQAGIPVVGVSETQPADEDYFSWMTHQLNKLEKALQQSQEPIH